MTGYSDGSKRLDFTAVVLVSQVVHYGRYRFDALSNYLGYPAGKLLVQRTRSDFCRNAVGINPILYRKVYPGEGASCVTGITP